MQTPKHRPSPSWSRRRFLGFGAALGVDLALSRADARETFEALARIANATLSSLASWAEAEGAEVSAHVADALTGRTLVEIAAHRPLNPASNQKLLTMAAALDTLSPSYQFETSLHGRVEGSSLRELVLRGNGDPGLKTADLAQLAQQLAERGIRAVRGDIFVDQSAFDTLWEPPGYAQKPNDWSAYRAPVSAVAIDRNAITLHVQPGAVGAPARSWLSPPGLLTTKGSIRTIANGRESVRFDVRRQTAESTAQIGGAVPATTRELVTTRRLADPALAAGRVLLRLLEERGIEVSGKLRNGGSELRAELASVRSPPLAELLLPIGKHSNNFAAEMLLKALGAVSGGAPGSSAAGAAAVVRYLTRIGALDPGTSVLNGSGLYDANRVSAATLTRVLRAAAADRRIGNEFIASLPIGGVDGTLSERFRSLRERRTLRAKTGTLADVTALAGLILRPPPDAPLVFAVLVNRAAGKVQEARRRMDAAIEAIALAC